MSSTAYWFGEAEKAKCHAGSSGVLAGTGRTATDSPPPNGFQAPVTCRLLLANCFDKLRYALIDFDTLKGIAMSKAKSGKATRGKSKNGKTKSGIGVLFYVTPA